MFDIRPTFEDRRNDGISLVGRLLGLVILVCGAIVGVVSVAKMLNVDKGSAQTQTQTQPQTAPPLADGEFLGENGCTMRSRYIGKNSDGVEMDEITPVRCP